MDDNILNLQSALHSTECESQALGEELKKLEEKAISVAQWIIDQYKSDMITEYDECTASEMDETIIKDAYDILGKEPLWNDWGRD